MAILALVISWPGARAAGSTLIWNANTEDDLAGYSIYIGSQPATYTNKWTIGIRTNWHTENLEFEKTFYAAVTAFSIYGAESDFSNEISFTIPRPAPVTITASKCDAGISITWPTAPGEIYRVATATVSSLSSSWSQWANGWEFITPEIAAMGLSLEWSDPMGDPERIYRVARIR